MFNIDKKKFGAFVAALRKKRVSPKKSCPNSSVYLIRQSANGKPEPVCLIQHC